MYTPLSAKVFSPVSAKRDSSPWNLRNGRQAVAAVPCRLNKENAGENCMWNFESLHKKHANRLEPSSNESPAKSVPLGAVVTHNNVLFRFV
eukprot:7092617-Pyramimonas_sp.AAC.1